jgi:hypothetical protein
VNIILICLSIILANVSPDISGMLMSSKIKSMLSLLVTSIASATFLHDFTRLMDGVFSNSYMNKVAAILITKISPYHQNDEQIFWCENPNCKTIVDSKNLIKQML